MAILDNLFVNIYSAYANSNGFLRLIFLILIIPIFILNSILTIITLGTVTSIFSVKLGKSVLDGSFLRMNSYREII